MRRTRRRIIRLFAAVFLVAAGGVLALVFFPRLPAELKEALLLTGTEMKICTTIYGNGQSLSLRWTRKFGQVAKRESCS